jgi:branched-chain amino acid transport system permease protein
MDFLLSYRSLFDIFLLHLGLAYSQYLVKRAGVFSIGTAGFAAIGAYVTAIGVVRFGVSPFLVVPIAALAGLCFGLLLSLPLARLRGVYQAIASLAFVQIVVSFNFYAENWTGGAQGFGGIPKLVGTGTLLIAAAATFYLIYALSQTRIGRAFDAAREDEAMASSLGVNVSWFQALAFGLSGLIAGLFGGLEALHSYAIEPNQFGFNLIIVVLSYVVFGGRKSIWGPLVGTAILVALPEISRPLAEQRMLIYGALLILIMNFMPRGVVDTIIEYRANRKAAKEKSHSAGTEQAVTK